MTQSMRNYLDFAIETAWLAGQLTLGYFQTGVRPDMKKDQSPVTVADRQAEEVIRARIEEQFPGQPILGEEAGYGEMGGTAAGATAAGASHLWFIDPIDGTRAFVRGVPLYAVLIGLEIEGEVAVGVAHFPALGEMIAAASGEGCWWNGRRTRVSPVNRLREGLLVHADTHSFGRYGRAEAWARLQAATAFRAGWSDAYGYLLVATGRAEVMVDPIMNAWDCAPFPPILREAGGYFGDWQGKPTIYGSEAMATTEALLPEVLAAING
jgi:histidinol-phosphatase